MHKMMQAKPKASRTLYIINYFSSLRMCEFEKDAKTLEALEALSFSFRREPKSINLLIFL